MEVAPAGHGAVDAVVPAKASPVHADAADDDDEDAQTLHLALAGQGKPMKHRRVNLGDIVTLQIRPDGSRVLEHCVTGERKFLSGHEWALSFSDAGWAFVHAPGPT